MKQEKDKRIFVIILVVVLVAVYIGSIEVNSPVEAAIGTIVTGAENPINLQNSSLYLEELDAESYFIGGEGELTQADIASLLAYNDVLATDVVNLVLGDGITEITYNCFNNYAYLQTLKLGEGTERVRNGGLRNCTALQYIYVPKSISKVGTDFLAGCTCLKTIVTDGTEEELEELFDTGSYTVIGSAYDESSLQEGMEREPMYSFSSEALTSTEPDAATDPILLKAGYIQYGPYASIPKGTYKVVISGANMDKVQQDNIYMNVEGTVFAGKDEAVIKADEISYTFTAENDIDWVEFCINNSGENAVTVTISRIDLYGTDVELIKLASYWW